jgi:hypothetical protein
MKLSFRILKSLVFTSIILSLFTSAQAGVTKKVLKKVAGKSVCRVITTAAVAGGMMTLSGCGDDGGNPTAPTYPAISQPEPDYYIVKFDGDAGAPTNCNGENGESLWISLSYEDPWTANISQRVVLARFDDLPITLRLGGTNGTKLFIATRGGDSYYSNSSCHGGNGGDVVFRTAPDPYDNVTRYDPYLASQDSAGVIHPGIVPNPYPETIDDHFDHIEQVIYVYNYGGLGDTEAQDGAMGGVWFGDCYLYDDDGSGVPDYTCESNASAPANRTSARKGVAILSGVNHTDATLKDANLSTYRLSPKGVSTSPQLLRKSLVSRQVGGKTLNFAAATSIQTKVNGALRAYSAAQRLLLGAEILVPAKPATSPAAYRAAGKVRTLK